jgi:eukaryotic-like serine/threonine-protein kinase
MGRVYLGEHARLGTKVAIKVLLEVDLPTVKDRFLAEAKSMARLNHPRVVGLVDYGHLPEGLPVLVMEYVEGESLADALDRRGPIPWRSACRWVCDALEGLEAAHAIGLVHRDIKPANLLVAGDGSGVKLADFGIAKPMVGGKLTATGHIIGTPDYMAPEVLAGQHATPISDVYAMGTTLFELLTGHPPFSGEPPLARFERDAPRLEESRSAPRIPQELSDVVARAIARVATRRWASADGFGTELGRVLREHREHPRHSVDPQAATQESPSSSLRIAAPARPVEGTRAEGDLPLPAADVGLALIVAALPPSRLAQPNERRFLAELTQPYGKAYSLGSGTWFAVVVGPDAEIRAQRLRDGLAARYGSLVRALVAPAPSDFKLSASQLSGAKPLPPPLPALLERVMAG